jgi:hypothetical protein
MSFTNNQFYAIDYGRFEVKNETKTHLTALFFKIKNKNFFKHELLLAAGV